RGRAEPVPGDLLLAPPAGNRPGAQRAGGRPGTAAPVRPPGVRLLRRHRHAAALHSPDRADRGPVLRHHRRSYRDTSRIAPYNLCAHTRQLLAQARGASTAHDIGFRFGPPPPGGKPARSASLAYPTASFHFTWSAAKHRWLVSMDGTPATTTDGG